MLSVDSIQLVASLFLCLQHTRNNAIPNAQLATNLHQFHFEQKKTGKKCSESKSSISVEKLCEHCIFKLFDLLICNGSTYFSTWNFKIAKSS